MDVRIDDVLSLNEISKIRYLFYSNVLEKNQKNRKNAEYKQLYKKLWVLEDRYCAERFLKSPKMYIKIRDKFQKVAVTKTTTNFAYIEYLKESATGVYTKSSKVMCCVMLDELYTELAMLESRNKEERF